MKHLWSVQKAAGLLGISPWTVRAYIRDGRLRPVRLGRRVLLEESELERFVAQCKRAEGPEHQDTDSFQLPQSLEPSGAGQPDENDLYQRWCNAPEEEWWEIQEQLFQRIVGHAQAAIWIGLHEWNPDLAQEIAFAVFRNLFRFREECKFSTFVHAIARNKVKELIRNRISWRKVFEHSTFETEEPGDNSDPLTQAVVTPDFDTPILLDELCDGLSANEAKLLECKYEGMSSEDVATILGITTEAVDSRWARLRPKLQKAFDPRLLSRN